MRLSETLPKLADRSSDVQLREAFLDNVTENKDQIERLKQVFEICEIPEKRVTCNAMAGLVKETEELLDSSDDDSVRDVAMITAAQKIKHYEIASYGSLAELAQTLGNDPVAKLLHNSLEQEISTDKRLTHLAVHGINERAQAGLLGSAI